MAKEKMDIKIVDLPEIAIIGNNIIIEFDDGSKKQVKYRDFTLGLAKSDSLIRKGNKRKK